MLLSYDISSVHFRSVNIRTRRFNEDNKNHMKIAGLHPCERRKTKAIKQANIRMKSN